MAVKYGARPSNGLSLDGGGARIYMTLCFMRRFFQLLNIPQKDFSKIYQLVTGTSAGAILALGLAFGKTLDELEPFFTQEVKWIFTIRSAADVVSGSINASNPSNRPNGVQKGLFLADRDPFYKSVSEDSNYGSARLKRALTTVFGDATMQDLKTNVVIPAYEWDTKTPRLFSNLDYPEFIGQNEKIVNVALASAAAPIYLPFPVFGGHTYADGGLFENNPALRNYVTLQAINKISSKYNILSVGTGLGKIGFDNEQPEFPDDPNEGGVVSDLYDAYDATATGNPEGIDSCLSFLAQYSLSNLNRYRYQPRLDILNYDTDLDNTDDLFQAYIGSLGTSIFDDDADAVATFQGHMSA